MVVPSEENTPPSMYILWYKMSSPDSLDVEDAKPTKRLTRRIDKTRRSGVTPLTIRKEALSSSSNVNAGNNGDSKKKQLSLPADASMWKREDIVTWLQWAESEFTLSDIDILKFPNTGPELSKLKVEDFLQITGNHHTAKILAKLLANWEYSITGKPQSPLCSTPVKEVKDIPAFYFPTSRTGHIHLWQFLLQLLKESEDKPSKTAPLCWDGSPAAGQFKLLDPDEVARLWGRRKGKPTMNYDKLSRALRYYYDRNMLTKVLGKRYTYKFDWEALKQACQPISSQPNPEAIAELGLLLNPGSDLPATDLSAPPTYSASISSLNCSTLTSSSLSRSSGCENKSPEASSTASKEFSRSYFSPISEPQLGSNVEQSDAESFSQLSSSRNAEECSSYTLIPSTIEQSDIEEDSQFAQLRPTQINPISNMEEDNSSSSQFISLLEYFQSSNEPDENFPK